MANPASYFSTLVQSSAAIVGFVVAFSTILYQLERREVNERTDTLREEFKQLSEKYEEVINNIKNSLYMNTERYDKDKDYLRDTSLGQSKLLEK